MNRTQHRSMLLGAGAALLLAAAAPAAADEDEIIDVARSPQQAAAAGFPILENDTLVVAISPRTGAIAGIWDVGLYRRVVQNSDDRYRMERLDGLTRSAERFDRVEGFAIQVPQGTHVLAARPQDR